MLVILPVTSPLRKKKHIHQAIKKFEKSKSDALITIKESDRNPYFNMIKLNKNKHAQIVNSKKKVLQEDRMLQRCLVFQQYVFLFLNQNLF